MQRREMCTWPRRPGPANLPRRQPVPAGSARRHAAGCIGWATCRGAGAANHRPAARQRGWWRCDRPGEMTARGPLAAPVTRSPDAPAHANRDTARRVVPLFRPYRARGAAVVGLIVLTSTIGMVDGTISVGLKLAQPSGSGCGMIPGVGWRAPYS